MKPIEARFLEYFFGETKGNSILSAVLCWPERYKNWKDDPKIRHRAEQRGYYLLQKLKGPIQELLDELGIGVFQRARKLKDLFEAEKVIKDSKGKEIRQPIYNVQLKALEMACRIAGDFSEDKVKLENIDTINVNLDMYKLTDSELDNLREAFEADEYYDTRMIKKFGIDIKKLPKEIRDNLNMGKKLRLISS